MSVAGLQFALRFPVILLPKGLTGQTKTCGGAPVWNLVAMTCGHVIARDGKLDPTILCVQPSIYHLKNQDNGTEIATSSIHAGRTCLKRRLYQASDTSPENRRQRDCMYSTLTTCPYFGWIRPINGHIPMSIGTRTLQLLHRAEPEHVTVSID
jgi:hypothetical protein